MIASYHGDKGSYMRTIINSGKKNNNSLFGMSIYVRSLTYTIINKLMSKMAVMSSIRKLKWRKLYKNSNAVANSTIGYSGDIFCLHVRHFPPCIMYEMIGMSSFPVSCVLQCGQ